MSPIKLTLIVLAVACVASSLWAAAPGGRYDIDVGAGTVKDNATGLTWQRAVSASPLLWGDAVTYCGSLGSGWRLPAEKELETLVDVRVGNPGPTVDSTAFPGTPSNVYWSATPHAANPASFAWYVDFRDGSSGTYNKGASRSVRCVR